MIWSTFQLNSDETQRHQVLIQSIMAGTFRFEGQSLDNELVASISCLLDSAGVPNLLWDKYLLTVYGVPTIVDGVAFVVPDELAETAYSTLHAAGFPSCVLGEKCARSATTVQQRPAQHSHLHINDELVVSLNRQSQTLLTFSSLDDLRATENENKNPNIMRASDSELPPARVGYGAGRFSPVLYPVWIPTAIKYCEALILLLCRDRGRSIRGLYWMAMLTYILEYVDGTDIFTEEALAEPYRRFYHALSCGDRKMFLILDDLRRDLTELHVLPPQGVP